MIGDALGSVMREEKSAFGISKLISRMEPSKEATTMLEVAETLPTFTVEDFLKYENALSYSQLREGRFCPAKGCKGKVLNKGIAGKFDRKGIRNLRVYCDTCNKYMTFHEVLEFWKQTKVGDIIESVDFGDLFRKRKIAYDKTNKHHADCAYFSL